MPKTIKDNWPAIVSLLLALSAMVYAAGVQKQRINENAQRTQHLQETMRETRDELQKIKGHVLWIRRNLEDDPHED